LEIIMKLIRWLLSNIILIAFVLALTYAYVYWDNLTGEDTPAGKLIAYLSTEYEEVSEFLDEYGLTTDKAEPEQTEPVSDVIETATVPQVAPPGQQLQPSSSQPAPPQAMMQQAPARQPVRPAYTETQRPAASQPGRSPYPGQPLMQQPPARQPLRPAFQDVMEPPVSQPPRPSVPEQAMMQQPRPVPPMPQIPPRREAMPVPEERDSVPMTEEQVSAADEPAATARELWISAREEYHRGNAELSIRNYKEVIAISMDNYDAYGEMGNVYLSQGNRKEAANAYFEAAAILVKLGETRRASSLLPMLGRLDRAKAEELNQLIRGASS
jgi:tetratricopeptide (TPR) repeat protein